MLQVKNLFVRYIDSRNPSIQDVSFDVKVGDRIAILGPSGCGKTTILAIIAGLLSNDKIEMSGELLWSDSFEKLTVRTVFQEATLLPWKTVSENIRLGLEIAKVSNEKCIKLTDEVLKMIGLMEYREHYPRQLSIGMQQRVNFARALVCNPDLLLLDEPFSALDIETKKNIQEEFLRILKLKKITSVFVTHTIQEAVIMANKIIILTKGPATVAHIIDDVSMQSDLLTNVVMPIDEFELYE